jgi:hypothetical protein
MVNLRIYLHGLLSLPSLFASTSAESFQDTCLKFQPQIESATLERLEFIPSGTSASLPYRDASCGGPGSSPQVSQDICRVALYVKTSERSGIQFEAWLPQDWNGRFLATGNGGIGGCKVSKYIRLHLC